MKYRKKPVVVEAFQLPTSPADGSTNKAHEDAVWAFIGWTNKAGMQNWTSEGDGCIAIETLEGTMTASPGDWIIKGVKGEFYPCKPDVFAATYELADVSLAAGGAVQDTAAWMTDDGRVITDKQKQGMLKDRGACASSVAPYSIPLAARVPRYAAIAAGGAQEPVGVVRIPADVDWDIHARAAWIGGPLPEGSRLDTAPLPREAATVALTTDHAFAFYMMARTTSDSARWIEELRKAVAAASQTACNKPFDHDLATASDDELAMLYRNRDLSASQRYLVSKHFAARAAVRTLELRGYTYLNGAQMWKPPCGKRPAWLVLDGDIDEKALETAREISQMWGRDRSQFVSRIQVAVRAAMDWMRRAVPSVEAVEHSTSVDDLAFTQTTDALQWAEAFDRIVLAKGVPIDVDLMLTWFANAIERGRDAGAQRERENKA
ncbi:hypothetical protein [Paraburkholderia antibiotica]|uniref:hypothetical protein n=1 Tax=Paraburkholderia antibiotica TaxID=2728839 RepID=UPI00197D512E|nr:hypothetical protein [Paraburkholderia antibiotica]